MLNYCPQCGTALEMREDGLDGMVPYCTGCGRFVHPRFNVAVSMVTIDEATQRILMIQQYGNPYNILVAGYVNHTENAESAVARELKEETGLTAETIRFNRSRYYAPSDTLIFNFAVTVKDASELSPNEEIDSCAWFTFDEARRDVKPNSLAQYFLESWLDNN